MVTDQTVALPGMSPRQVLIGWNSIGRSGKCITYWKKFSTDRWPGRLRMICSTYLRKTCETNASYLNLFVMRLLHPSFC